MKKNPHIDYYRILALLILALGILYFYANLFYPRIIPWTFRLGIIRRPTTILLAGTDLNFDVGTNKPLKESNGRTDTLILLRVDPVRHRLNSLSIPRDSFVEIPGHGYNKINAANVFGGIELTRKTVSGLIGQDIDYYLEINPEMLIKLVDLAGGVKYYVEKDMYYIDHAQGLNINLKQGWRKLSGLEAQNYLRFRHDALGDIGRMERQQKFLQALFLNFTSPANIFKAPIALEIAIKGVRTNLSLGKLIRLGNFARMISPANIHAFTAPVEEGGSNYAGQILLIEKTGLEKILKDNF